MIVEGHMQWLFDEKGKRYLDMLAGIVTVSCGHCHPKVTKAIHDQVDRLQHATTIYLHPGLPEFSKKLASKMPKGLDVTYFVNSGSEANDLAIQIARLYTGNTDVIALRNSYHGASPFTNTLTSHSTWKYPVNVSSGIHHAMNPDPYRSPASPGARLPDPGSPRSFVVLLRSLCRRLCCLVFSRCCVTLDVLVTAGIIRIARPANL
jgi:alanine-glyoxylate transaminase/(R)-3-amino-2-methylpropionate-pyruvate transaminase